MADPPRGALVARVMEKGAAIDTQLLFFGLEIAALDDEAADALSASPELENWRHWLQSLRKYRPYLLSEPEEKIITEKAVSGFGAWDRLYDELLGAIRVDLDGDQISFEDAMSRLYSGDRDVRRTAAEAVTEALAPGLRTRAFIFNTLVVDKSIDDRLRGYESWISARNLGNDTTDEEVQALIDATTSRYDVVQRYYKLKAKLIGVDQLAHYDRFAPVGDDPSKVPWDEARELVTNAYSDFAQEAGDVAERFFSARWIDAPVRDNKRTGAFCATNVPGVHPYILMNYTGDRRSILTLAHELGHGLHGYLAQPLGLFNASTPLTTAETASVFGEALTFKRLLALEEDPQRRLNLLAGRIEDSIATVFRQIAMNRFEDTVHNGRRQEGELAVDRFEELWLEAQRDLFADSVDIESYGTWWSYIPHFMGTPGYVYAYAYGFLFALTIFRKYEVEGESLVEPVLRPAPCGRVEDRLRSSPRSSGSTSTTRRSGRAGSTRSRWRWTRRRRSPPRSGSAERSRQQRRPKTVLNPGRARVPAVLSRLTGRNRSGEKEGVEVRKLIACGVGLVAALAFTVPGAFGGAEQTPGVTAKIDHDRRHVPADRRRRRRMRRSRSA